MMKIKIRQKKIQKKPKKTETFICKNQRGKILN